MSNITIVRSGFAVQPGQIVVHNVDSEENSVPTKEIMARNQNDAAALYNFLSAKLPNGTFQRLRRLMIENG